jgi:hypothetical protein
VNELWLGRDLGNSPLMGDPDHSQEHFKALESDVEFMVANNYTTFSEKVSST